MEKYGLHNRQRRLLYLLNCEHGVVTGKDLAAKLGISERTVRNDIGEINEKMAAYKLEILATRGKGYFLKVGNRKVFHELFADQTSVQTKEDRIKYLILRLVRAHGWCDMMELEDDMFVSRTTLENDLREIRHRITCNQPYIELIREGNNVRLADDEVKRRNIMVRIYSENWDYDSRDGIILKDNEMNPESLDKLRKIWKSLLRQNSLELDDFGLIYIIMASAVAHVRLIEGCQLPDVILERKNAASKADWRSGNGGAGDRALLSGSHGEMPFQIKNAVSAFWKRMELEWQMKASLSEHWWLQDILRQLIILNFNSSNKMEMALVTDLKCRELADTLIFEIAQQYRINFGEDKVLRTDIILHIQAMLNSMVSVQTQSKYMIDELRLRYPFLGHIAHDFCQRLKEKSHIVLGREDEDYILPLLIAGWKRLAQNRTKNEIRAVLVSHLNYGLSYGLLDGLRTRFGARMIIDGPFPIYDRKRIDEMVPSIIITTARMDAFRKYSIPVLTISPLMESGEWNTIEKCLNRLVCQKMFPDPPRGRDYFRHKKLELTIERRMELPAILSLIEENLRGNLFVNEILAVHWDQCYYTLLNAECLFVCMTGGCGQDTVMASVICKYVTSWRQNRNIRKIIFMIINENESGWLGSFYRLLMEENNG